MKRIMMCSCGHRVDFLRKEFILLRPPNPALLTRALPAISAIMTTDLLCEGNGKIV